MIPTDSHFIIFSTLLFVIGALGMLINTRNLLRMLLSLELMLLASNVSFVFFAARGNNAVGQLFSLMTLVIAAVEAALGLAIFLLYFRSQDNLVFQGDPHLKG
jgi:NADH-quinone oxidoreductase subunit K